MLTVDTIKYFTDLGEKTYQHYKNEVGNTSEMDMFFHVLQRETHARESSTVFMVENIKNDACVKIKCRNYCGPNGNYIGNDALEFIGASVKDMFGGMVEQSAYDPGSAIIRLLSSLNHNFDISIER